MQRVDFLRRWCQSVLGHSGQNLDNLLSEVCSAKVVEVVRMSRSEGFSHDHDASVVRIRHFFVLLACEESKRKGVVYDLFPVAFVGTVDYIDVAGQEIVRKISARSKVKQVEHICLLVVQVVGWIGISLHNLPLKEFSEAQLEHETSYSVPELLRLLHQCVDFDSIHELGTQDLLVRQVFDNFWSIVLAWGHHAGVVVACLIGSLSKVVTFVMKLRARHFY